MKEHTLLNNLNARFFCFCSTNTSPAVLELASINLSEWHINSNALQKHYCEKTNETKLITN